MSAATMIRASTASAAHGSAARPSSSRAARPRASLTPSAPRASSSRLLTVSPSAYYCRPSGGLPSARIVRTPNFYRRAPSPTSLFNLAFGAPLVASEMADWLSKNLNEPLQHFATSTHEDRYELTSDVPGMGPEDITVEVTPEGFLRLHGERKGFKDVQGEDGTVTRQQTTTYSFERSFELPDDALPDQVSASLDKGVLTVSVPRKAAEPKPQPRRVAVSVSAKPMQAAAVSKPDADPKAEGSLEWPAPDSQE